MRLILQDNRGEITMNVQLDAEYYFQNVESRLQLVELIEAEYNMAVEAEILRDRVQDMIIEHNYRCPICGDQIPYPTSESCLFCGVRFDKIVNKFASHGR